MLHSVIVTIVNRTDDDRGDHWVVGPRPDDLRPLGPRSIVLSILLGSHPPEMSVSRLLEFTALFGLAPGSVRTALSRMVAAGDLHNHEGRYRLTDRLRERQAQQDAGRSRPTQRWDGTWWFAIVTADRRTVAERREFRERVAGARFGELRPETWLRPANIDVPLDLPDIAITRGPLIRGSDRELVGQLWDLGELEHRASGLLDALRGSRTQLRRQSPADALPAAFTTMAATQRFLRLEPQLPPELASGSTSDDLRAIYDEVVRLFETSLLEFFGRRVSTGAR